MKTISPESDEVRKSLIADIEVAFADVKREDGVTIHEAEIIDRYGSDEEQQEARKLDTETRWQDVPDDVMDWHSGFCFLDLKGFRYYLPAYMTWILKNLYTRKYNSGDSLIYSLVRIGDRHEEWHCWANVPEAYRNPDCACRFTATQRDVVRRFLEYIVLYEPDSSDENAASEALQKWEQIEKLIATERDTGQRMMVQCILHMPDGTVVEVPPE
ncbi:MAG: hypothetical protein K1X57_11540 [Gemmataceae bacterium]|nr:hypothetical protein [Gemmataceae bacterium]